MKRFKTLNAFVFLSIVAIPVVASPKQQIHSTRLILPSAAFTSDNDIWLATPKTQFSPGYRPVLGAALYSPQDAGDVSGAEEGERPPGQGLWWQLTAGCGLLLFGALRRIAGL